MKSPVWAFLAKEWLKRNWRWLLFPIGLLLLILGYGLAPRRKVVVTNSAVSEADKAVVKINVEAEGKRKEADAAEASQLAGVSAQHSAAVAVVTQKQIDAVDDAQGDPDKDNSLLLNVGKDMRR